MWTVSALAGLLFMLIKPRSLKLVTCIALTAGITFSAMAVGAAWDHNPQEEFHSADQVHWGALLSIGLSWLVVISSMFGLAGWLRSRSATE
jgi:hypothetical protein